MRNIAVKLTKAGESAIRTGHPWIYESSLTKLSRDGEAGDLCVIYGTRSNKVIAIGLYDPDSPIRVKVVQHDGPAKVNPAFWHQKLQSAMALRAPLLATQTTGYRWINGENDGMPSLIVDCYDKVVVVKVYSRIWLPYLESIYDCIVSILQPTAIVQRVSRVLEKAAVLENATTVRGHLTDPLVHFVEHGVRFSAHVTKGHKTGYFLDHRESRRRIGSISHGKTVLDVFSYAGGFTAHAAAGGAAEVLSIDISRQALEVAEYNVSLNPHHCRHTTLCMDAFTALQQLEHDGQMFDVVVVDPPSFAKSNDEKNTALRQYQRLASQSARLVRREGTLLLASCSARVSAEEFHQASEEGLRRSGRNYQRMYQTAHDVDHPVTFPQGAYLKSGYYRIA